MNKVKSLSFAACTALLLITGCAETQRFKAVEQIWVPNLEKQQAMEAAEDVLGQMHFTIEKSDLKHGLIRTRPLAGAQFFEFWRSDNVGGFNWAEANLHSIRRTVELNIDRQDEQLCIGCNVKTQRLHLPEHPVSSTAQAYRLFSESRSSMQELKLNPEQQKDMRWVDLGRDVRLETEILKRIEKQITAQQKGKTP